MSKNVTINGAGKTYTGTMTVNNVTATIQNVAFVEGQVYKHKNTGLNANITVKDCTFDGQGLNAYALNLGGTNSIVIENVTAKNYGYGLLQVPSATTKLTVKDVEVSDMSYGIKVDYATAVVLENVTIANNVTIGIYDSNHGAKTYTIKNSDLSAATPIKVWERNQTVYDTFKFEGVNTVAALPESQFAKIVAGGMIGTTVYGELQAAIDAATEGQTVEIISNVALTEGVTVATDDVIFIDLNGNTITGTPAEAKAYAVITNKGTLAIEGEGAIVCNHTLAGSTSYAVNTIVNSADLTIDGATIENKSTASNQIGYAIDNNSTSADATVTVVSGNVTVSGSNYYDGIRQFCNSTTAENNVTVEGGKVSSIWMQNPSDGASKNTKDVNGSVTIEGGEVTALYLEPSANFEAAITAGHVGNVSYFETAEGRDLKEFVTGGTFGTLISENFLAWGYQLTGNAAPYTVEWTGRREALTIVDGEEFVNENSLEVGTLTYVREFPEYDCKKWTSLYLPFELSVSELDPSKYDVAYINNIYSHDGDGDGIVDRMETEYIHIKSGTLYANTPYLIKAKTEDACSMELVLNNVELHTINADDQNVIECASSLVDFKIGGTYKSMDADDVLDAYDSTLKPGATPYAYHTLGGEWWSYEGMEIAPFSIYMHLAVKPGTPFKISPEALKSIGSRVVGEEIDGTTIIYDVEAENNSEDMIFDLSGRRVLETVKGGIYIKNGKKFIAK